MSSIRSAGRDSALSCLFAVLILGIVGVVAWPLLGDASVPLWRRLAAVTAGPLLGWLGALLLMVVAGASIGGILSLRDRARRRALARLVDALAGGDGPLPPEHARTLERALARSDSVSRRLVREETGRLVEVARSAGPRRLAALRLLLRHGDGWDEAGPVRRVLREGAELLEAEPLPEEDRKRLGWWMSGPSRP